MKRQIFASFMMLLLTISVFSQKKNTHEIKEVDGKKLTTVTTLKATTVKDQARTGTCWSFATTSFIESELLRMGKGEYDLSEMWVVRNNYIDKLHDNFLQQGNGNLNEGSLAHDWMIEFTSKGIVPDEVYTGLNYSLPRHNHSELSSMIKAIGKVAVDRKKESDQYLDLINDVLDEYLGEMPESFIYKGVRYTPQSFAQSLGISPDDYVEITSFTHFPFYTKGPVPVPDNWRKLDMYNVPLDEFVAIMNYSLMNGYTFGWDGDTSEEGFKHRNGIALLTGDGYDENAGEAEVTQETRQVDFENKSTTDDHMMHITGLAKDKDGNDYYITKNSWGETSNTFGGYLNMSEDYARAKTIFILVHRDAVPQEIREKLGI
ncbi:MAG TPA: C1 family peptidase [Bacteroidales bacterium]|nr:C1 family peptidase [Bacteroidales bacterium]